MATRNQEQLQVPLRLVEALSRAEKLATLRTHQRAGSYFPGRERGNVPLSLPRTLRSQLRDDLPARGSSSHSMALHATSSNRSETISRTTGQPVFPVPLH